MARDQGGHLDVPGELRGDQSVVHPATGRPEEVGGAIPEGIGEQEGELGLDLEGEQAEVVGHQVGECNRDQDMAERAGEVASGGCPRHGRHAPDPHGEDQGNDQHAQSEHRCRPQPARGQGAEPDLSHPRGDGVERTGKDSLLGAVEGRRADGGDGDGNRPGTGDPGRGPRHELADAEAPLPDRQLSEGSEHPEIDREDLPVRKPLLPTEESDHRQRVDGVDDRSDCDRLRLDPDRDRVTRSVDQLEPDHREETDRGGPPPQSLRVDEV